MIIVLDASDADTQMLTRDGSAIQRLISDLHGAQRCRLGWPESAVRREFAILTDVVVADLQDQDYPDQTDVAHGIVPVKQMLMEAERVSLRGWRLANGTPAHA